MKTKLLLLLAATMTLSHATPREGIFLSLGGGFSSVDTEFNPNGLAPFTETSSGWSTSLRFGVGLSDQLLVYYTNDLSWFRYDNDVYDDLYYSGISGIGMSYYLDERSPFYVLGSVGVSNYKNYTTGSSANSKDLAYSIGAGFDVTPNFQLEASYISTVNEFDGFEYDTGSMSITAHYRWQ